MRKESHASVSSHRVAVACLLVCFPVCGLLCHVFLPSDGSGHHQLCLMAVFRISVTCEYTHTWCMLFKLSIGRAGHIFMFMIPGMLFECSGSMHIPVIAVSSRLGCSGCVVLAVGDAIWQRPIRQWHGGPTDSSKAACQAVATDAATGLGGGVFGHHARIIQD